jgi:hypothetical protein
MKRIIILALAFFASFRVATGQVTNEHIDAYLWEHPLQQGLVLQPELVDQLVAEIQRIIDSGDFFFRPLPNDFGDQLEDSYFLYREPGRILQTIAMAYPYLDATRQNNLRTMVQQLFSNTQHRPWASVPGQSWLQYQLPLDEGKHRRPIAPTQVWGNVDFGIYRPTIQNVYNVWLYVYRTGDLASVAPYYNAIRDFYLSKVGNNHDQGRLYSSMNSHIGMARLAHLFGQQSHIDQARSNLASALNFGLNMDLVDTLARRGTQGWNGAYTFAYTDRAINRVNLNYIFLNISPEIGRYLQEYLPAQTEARHNTMLNRFPLWFLREAPYFNRWTGDESIGIPGNTFGINVPLERWFRNVDAETLASYMISSPVGIADSYWLEALIMAIEANASDVFVDVRDVPFETDIVQDFVWLGITSNDWHEPSNWVNSEVPGAVNNVIIPETVNSFPTLSAAGECNNLLILSSELGTASLIDNGFLTVHGVTVVQRYIGATNWNDSQHGWHLLSSPVQNQSIDGIWTPSGEGNDYDFYSWTDANVPLPWLNQKQPANQITHFVPGAGYLVAYQTADVKEFSGSLNTGNVNFELSYSNGSSYAGWNLMGNPFQSAIDWSLANKNAFQDDFAYIYDSNREGGPGYVPVGGAGATLSLIPLNQGFFVLANNNQNEQPYSILSSLRTHGGQWLKNPNYESIDAIELQLSHSNFFDRARIQLLENSQFSRDRKDALKLGSLSSQVPSIFSLSENGSQLEINSIPFWNYETSVLIGFSIPETGLFEIELTKAIGEFWSKNLVLEDLETGLVHSLDLNQRISFLATQNQNSPRFRLAALQPSSINHHNYKQPSILHWQGNLIVDLGENHYEVADLFLFDSTGRLVFSEKIRGNKQSIPVSLTPGVYLSMIIINSNQYISKVSVVP